MEWLCNLLDTAYAIFIRQAYDIWTTNKRLESLSLLAQGGLTAQTSNCSPHLSLVGH